jgi:poly(A) polymerase
VENPTLEILRRATRGTEYEGRLWIVGGYVRDKLLGRENQSEDIDLVLEGDALAVADLLWRKGVTDHKPVEYGQFGTTQIEIHDEKVEIVTARAETYRQGSRKPIVKPGNLETDARRRDFTVNTFLENLHTGEIRDPTGLGRPDLAAGILRTPLSPDIIFGDDPLRMLRACRFAAKLGFTIDPATFDALATNADKCRPEHGISYERVRDELIKTLLAPDASRGLELMRETRLLDQFAPELSALFGVDQNRFHCYDVWTHTLVALSNLPGDATLTVRLAVLLHDIGKPATRTADPEGNVHFYGHEEVGADIVRTLLNRLRFPSVEIDSVVRLVRLHMRYGATRPDWSDAAVRRLIRDVGPYRDALFQISRADISACRTHDAESGALLPTADLDGLAERMARIQIQVEVMALTSPLTGQQIMDILGVTRGPLIGKVKAALTDAVVSGELAPDDTAGAERLARFFVESS